MPERRWNCRATLMIGTTWYVDHLTPARREADHLFSQYRLEGEVASRTPGHSVDYRSAGEAINEFPTGFRMMAGSAGRSSYNATNKADLAVNWICLGGKGNNNTPGKPHPL